MIQEKINNIRKAVFGKDVRESIASAIEEIYAKVIEIENKQIALEEKVTRFQNEYLQR